MAKMYKPGDEDDPFQKPRPKFGLAAATGRTTEAVYGADFPQPNELMEWSEHLRAQGRPKQPAIRSTFSGMFYVRVTQYR